MGSPARSGTPVAEPDLELLYKLHQIRDVLERSKIAGFNRKLQLKPRKFEQKTIEVVEGPDGERTTQEQTVETCSELMLILKWGGDLTKLGERQAERLGERFTQAMYPDPRYLKKKVSLLLFFRCFDGPILKLPHPIPTSSGGGILRLHSTFRHDMKIKASDEGRVMKTAAAFTKVSS